MISVEIKHLSDIYYIIIFPIITFIKNYFIGEFKNVKHPLTRLKITDFF